MAFARDESLSLVKFLIILLSLTILIFNQKRKFDQGRKITLMKIRETKYENIIQNYSKGKDCSICLKDLEKNDLVKILPCSK